MDKIDSLVADRLPLFIVYTEFASFNFFDYLVIISSIERWIPAEQNVQDNTNTPEITLLVVFII